jgi:hypothetical protein
VQNWVIKNFIYKCYDLIFTHMFNTHKSPQSQESQRYE